MTPRTDFDRELAAYLKARETSRAPDWLGSAVRAGIVATPQRAAWRTLVRWLPGRVAGWVAPSRRAVGLIILVVLVLALAIALVVAPGSRRRLPPPLGPARPGLIVVDQGGDLSLLDPDGAPRTQLTSGPDIDDRETWSPDGTMIAFRSQLADLSMAVVVIGQDGRGRLVVADHLADVGPLVWSPDSARVAFSGRFNGDHLVHVYVGDARRDGVVRLGGPDLFAAGPSWSPDGSQIAFKRIDPTADDAIHATGDLWLMNSDGTNPHQLSSLGGGENALWNTAWSPDGKWIAFLAVNGGFDIYVISPDGKGLRNLSHSSESESWPSWSPDGTRIAFSRIGLTTWNLVVMDPDGSHEVDLTGPPVSSKAPVWSPDGTQLLAYANPDSTGDVNAAIALLDPTGRVPALSIPAAMFRSASWQRLAP
jgi:Tol biopolymer transport system component